MSTSWKYVAPPLLSMTLSLDAYAFWGSKSKAEKELENMSYSLVFSEKFGTWRDQGQSGVFRLIIVDANEKFPHSLAFLQWIKTPFRNERTSSGHVIASVPIKEINYSGAYKLNEPKVAGAEGALGGIAEVTGVNNYTHSAQSIRIQPNDVGQYTATFINGPTERFGNVSRQVEDIVFSIPASK